MAEHDLHDQRTALLQEKILLLEMLLGSAAESPARASTLWQLNESRRKLHNSKALASRN